MWQSWEASLSSAQGTEMEGRRVSSLILTKCVLWEILKLLWTSVSLSAKQTISGDA